MTKVLSKNKVRVISIIKTDFQSYYGRLDPEKVLNDYELWVRIQRIITHSKSNHHGMDMSGLLDLLRTIKKNHNSLFDEYVETEIEDINNGFSWGGTIEVTYRCWYGHQIGEDDFEAEMCSECERREVGG